MAPGMGFDDLRRTPSMSKANEHGLRLVVDLHRQEPVDGDNRCKDSRRDTGKVVPAKTIRAPEILA